MIIVGIIIGILIVSIEALYHVNNFRCLIGSRNGAVRFASSTVLYSKPRQKNNKSDNRGKQNKRSSKVKSTVVNTSIPPDNIAQPKSMIKKSILGENIITCRGFNIDGAKEFDFLGSYTDISMIPEYPLPEVAFIGRSNVGKSSLLNCLTKKKKNIAVTSKTPGRTQCINLFKCSDKLGDICNFVDLPGYGYAKISKSQQEDIALFIRNYLKKRGALKLVVLLVDVRREPQEQDLRMAEFLEEEGLSCVMVATKVDTVKKTELEQCAQRLVEGFEMEESGIILFSAVTGEGSKDIWKSIQAGILAEDEP